MDDDRRAVAAEPAEVLVDQVSGLNRFGSRRLPAGSGERGFHARREEAEPDRKDKPCRDDDHEVRSRPAAQPPDWADVQPAVCRARYRSSHRGRAPGVKLERTIVLSAGSILRPVVLTCQDMAADSTASRTRTTRRRR